MKAAFNKKQLLSALGPAAEISQTKNTWLSCDGLLFECPPDKRFGDYDLGTPDLCRISAFDFEKGLRTTIGCTVHEKGMCVIPAQTVLAIVRALPDGEITLEVSANGSAVISGGNVNFRTSAAPGENFPSMPMFIGTNIYTLPQYRLRRILGETVFAVAQNDQLRMGFNGGLFRIRNGDLTVVGCDNYKLAASGCPVSAVKETAEETEIIIPGKFLSELFRLLSDTEDEVTMILGRKHVIFNFNGLYFFTRLLETEYPDYAKMLPATYMTQVHLSRIELLEAIERASIIAEAKLGGIGGAYVKLEFTENTVVVSSVSSSGAIDETLWTDMSGAALTIGFECRNLLETLKACPTDCEQLRLRLNSPLMGVMIEPSGGSAFLETFPDPSVYGDHNVPVETKNALDIDKNRFMYFVLPTRMNIPVK